MRYPPEHKAETKARIVRAAARALRKKGLGGVSVPAIMKQAGLTHGGFYGHFRGRDALVAEAVRLAADETAQNVFGSSPDVGAALARYLSEEHVAHPESGCVLAALGSDAREAGPAVRKAFDDIARGFVGLVAQKRGEPAGAPSDRTLLLASQMVGAVVLARLVGDARLRSRLLAAAARA